MFIGVNITCLTVKGQMVEFTLYCWACLQERFVMLTRWSKKPVSGCQWGQKCFQQDWKGNPRDERRCSSAFAPHTRGPAVPMTTSWRADGLCAEDQKKKNPKELSIHLSCLFKQFRESQELDRSHCQNHSGRLCFQIRIFQRRIWRKNWPVIENNDLVI